MLCNKIEGGMTRSMVVRRAGGDAYKREAVRTVSDCESFECRRGDQHRLVDVHNLDVRCSLKGGEWTQASKPRLIKIKPRLDSLSPERTHAISRIGFLTEI